MNSDMQLIDNSAKTQSLPFQVVPVSNNNTMPHLPSPPLPPPIQFFFSKVCVCGRSVGEGIKTSSAEWGKVKLLVKHNACYKHTNSIGKIMVYIPNAITSHTDTFQEANGVQINSFSLNNVLNSYNYCFMTTTCITSEDNLSLIHI